VHKRLESGDIKLGPPSPLPTVAPPFTNDLSDEVSFFLLISAVNCNRKKLFTCQQEAFHVSNWTQTFAFRIAMPGHPGKEADWQSYSQVVHNLENPQGSASETAVPSPLCGFSDGGLGRSIGCQ
jgi:hypothetical protein